MPPTAGSPVLVPPDECVERSQKKIKSGYTSHIRNVLVNVRNVSDVSYFQNEYHSLSVKEIMDRGQNVIIGTSHSPEGKDGARVPNNQNRRYCLSRDNLIRFSGQRYILNNKHH